MRTALVRALTLHQAPAVTFWLAFSSFCCGITNYNYLYLFLTCGFSCCSFSTGLFLLRTILGTALLPILHTGRIQTAANDMITYTRQILHTTSADQHDGVLLEIMTFTGNIGDHLYLIRQTHLGHLAQSGVGLLGSRRIYTGTYSTTLRTSIQSPGLAFCTDNLSSFSN